MLEFFQVPQKISVLQFRIRGVQIQVLSRENGLLACLDNRGERGVRWRLVKIQDSGRFIDAAIVLRR